MVWYDTDTDFLRAKNTVSVSKIPEADKQNIFDLVNKLLATKIGKRRAIKYYYNLNALLQRGYFQTFQDITEQDLYHVLAEIEHSKDMGGMAKRDYKISIKRMLEHLNNPLSGVIKTAAKPNYLPKHFLTVHDILKMIKTDAPVRDKAMAACLYESNCRPHEFFMLKKSDIRFEVLPANMWDGNGKMLKINLELAFFNINPESKTGPRNPPLLFSVPWLKAWLDSVLPGKVASDQDPDRNEDHLWTMIHGPEKGARIEYPAVRKAIKQIAESAGIKYADKVTLYSFRHGRNTEVSQYMSNAQQCEYAGWHQGSDMPRVYNHLNGKSMLSPLLSPYGIVVENAQDDKQAWMEIMRAGQKYSGTEKAALTKK